MEYGPDCVKFFVWFAFSLGCIAGVCKGLMKLMRLNKEDIKENKYCELSKKSIGAACSVSAMWVCAIMWQVEGMMQGVMLPLYLLGLSIIISCLLTASIMDIETHLIYNYVWWLGVSAGVFLMLLMHSRMWMSVLAFLVMQECLFMKMYGRADCHGFVVCSMAEAALGMGLREYLIHMLIAFGMMGAIQLLRGNIGRRGKLKEPVPFLPYITVALGLNLIAYLCV